MDAIQIILPKGDPNGLKIIELTGWSGKCLILPRTELRSLKDRPEVTNSGLYFLFGEDKETGDQLAYIGESSNPLSRLNSHDAQKDFWNEAVVFVNPPNRNYLEAISIKKAKGSKRYIIKNGKEEGQENQNEFEEIKNRKYFEGVQKILSTFGYKIFEEISESYADDHFYYFKTEDTQAKARVLNDGSLLVYKGALARIRETESFGGWSFAARRRYIKEDKMILSSENPKSYVFSVDIIYKSPSAAASTLSGKSTNGWTAWKDEKGNTLDENIRKQAEIETVGKRFIEAGLEIEEGK